MNPDIIGMLDDVLSRGFDALVLTNAMKPMRKLRPQLLALREALRRPAAHPRLARPLRAGGARGGARAAKLGADDRRPGLAGAQRVRHRRGRPALLRRAGAELRAGFATAVRRARCAGRCGTIRCRLVLFPEMDAQRDVPEITTACWGILHKSPDDVMCASARMVVKRKGAATPAVLACTLLAYDPQFELGRTLAEAARPVSLNHPYCASFCVLGRRGLQPLSATRARRRPTAAADRS